MRQTPLQRRSLNPAAESGALKALQESRKRYEIAVKHSKIAADIWVEAQQQARP
jgi:hypothetical protein